MNQHLHSEAKRLARVPPPSEAATPPPPVRRPWSWRSWTALAAILFGVYVFLGPFVLRPELQWSAVIGTIEGQKTAAATIESTSAEAKKAGAVAEQTERAKVDPAIEIASAAAAIEIGKAAALARIEVEKQDKLNRLAAVQESAAVAAGSYARCMDRAQTAAENAGSNGNTTYGAREIARQATLAQAQAACEHLMSKEEKAKHDADIARAWAEQNK